jgi:hypothetical protein
MATASPKRAKEFPKLAPIYSATTKRKNNRVIQNKITWFDLLVSWFLMMIKKDYNEGVTNSNPTQKCRPAKGISKRVHIQIIKDTDITEHSNNK